MLCVASQIPAKQKCFSSHRIQNLLCPKGGSGNYKMPRKEAETRDMGIDKETFTALILHAGVPC
jgi:hypothetical protein